MSFVKNWSDNNVLKVKVVVTIDVSDMKSNWNDEVYG